MTDLGINDLALTSNWMHRTRWATTFAGADRLLLVLLTDRPAASGHQLSLGRYGITEMYSSVGVEVNSSRVTLAAPRPVQSDLECQSSLQLLKEEDE